HPGKMRGVDAEHRRARADQRIKSEDGLVRVFLREPLHHVYLGADRDRRARGRVPNPFLEAFGGAHTVGDGHDLVRTLGMHDDLDVPVLATSGADVLWTEPLVHGAVSL